MEDEWNKVFNKAKKLITVKGTEEDILELLRPFRGVKSKTPFIQSLFNERQLFNTLANKLARKEFKEFFALVNRYPFLTESEEYKKVIAFSENLLEQAKKFLKKGEFSKVMNIIDILEEFPQMVQEVQELKDKADILLIFQRVLATNDLNKIESVVKKISIFRRSRGL